MLLGNQGISNELMELDAVEGFSLVIDLNQINQSMNYITAYNLFHILTIVLF
jgi:hypothetical protein